MYVKKPTKFVFYALFIPAIIIIAAWIFMGKAGAATPSNQTVYSSSIVLSDATDLYTNRAYFTFGSSTIGDWSGQLEGFQIKFNVTSNLGVGDPNTPVTVVFFEGTIGSCSPPTILRGNVVADVTSTPNYSSGFYVDFNDSYNTGYGVGAVTLSSSSYYGIGFNADGRLGQPTTFTIYGKSPNNFLNTTSSELVGGVCSAGVPNFFPYIFFGSSTPPSLTGNVEILFPEDEQIIPDFSNWVLGLSDLEENEVYYGIVYYAPSSTDPVAQNYYYQDTFSVISTTSTIIWTVPKFNRLPDDPTSTIGYFDTWEVVAQLFSDINFSQFIASSPIVSFTPDRSQPNPTSTYAALVDEFYDPPSVLDREECGALTLNFWSDTPVENLFCNIKYGFLNLVEAIADFAGQIGEAGFNKIIGLLTKIFPFREISAINDIVNDVQEATSTFSITLSGAGLWGGHSYNILNGSSSAWIEDEAGFDYRGLLSKIFYAITLGIILITTIKVLKTTHDQSSGGGQQ